MIDNKYKDGLNLNIKGINCFRNSYNLLQSEEYSELSVIYLDIEKNEDYYKLIDINDWIVRSFIQHNILNDVDLKNMWIEIRNGRYIL